MSETYSEELSAMQACYLIKAARRAGAELSVVDGKFRVRHESPDFADTELCAMLVKHADRVSLTVLALEKAAREGYRENF